MSLKRFLMHWQCYRGTRSPCIWTQYPPRALPHCTLFFSDTVVAQSRWTPLLPASGACQVQTRYCFEAPLPAALVAETSNNAE